MTEHQPATVPASSTSVNMKETAFLMPLAFLFYICNIRNRFGLSTRHINGYGHAAASNQKNPCFEVLGIPYALPQLRDLKTETKANHVHVDSKDPELCTVLLNDGGVDDNDESDSHEHKITPIGSYNETHSFVATDNMEWNDVQPRFSRHTKEIKWIRLSQFPYVPPFIKFCQHNEECEYLLPTEVKTKLKWRLSKITHFALRETISSTGFQLLENTTEWTGQWEKYTKTNMSQAALKDYQKVNHIPATFELGRKDRLWQNFQRYSIKFGLENFGFMSKSYILPQEMESFKQAWDTYPKGIPWIIKPWYGKYTKFSNVPQYKPVLLRPIILLVTCLGKRYWEETLMSLANLFLVINKWKQIPKKRSTVIQKYISNPYLINSKKFDIRIYALVTSFHPLKIYIYRGGHARFATAKYSQNFHNVSNRFMHVTSSAVNRHNKLYFVDQSSELYEGNNWPLSLLWRYLKDKNHDTNELWRLIEEIVIKTIICAEDHIIGSASNLPSRYNGYELFGLDIILDEKLKPWLLEVNMTPSLKYVSISGLSTIRYLIKNMLNIVGYHFPPTTFKFLKNAMNENIKLETPVFDRRLYSTMLSTEEKLKQNLFKRMRSSVQNVSKILENLTPDDVRYLIQAEDELSQCSVFSRIFPTASTNKYLKFLEGPRYYDILLDAWERKYFCNRARGIRRLQKLCNKKFHL